MQAPTTPGAFLDRFPALKVRNFRLFWTGQLVSLAGTWMQNLGQSWLVLELTGSPLKLGTVSALQFLPMMLLSVFAGPLVDHFPKRKILVFTQSCLALLALSLAILTATGLVRYWMVLVLASLLGLVQTLDVPARQSFMSEVAGREALVNAISLNSTAFNAARILGPSLAGLLIAAIGVAPCFFLNSASFLAVIAALLRMEGLPPPPPRKGGTGPRAVIGSAVEGLGYVRARRELFLPLILLAVFSTVVINYNIVVPTLARGSLGLGARGYGFLMAALGAGSLSAAFLMAAGGRKEPRDRSLILAALGMGLSFILLGLQRWIASSAALLFTQGFCTVSLSARTNAAVQLRSDDEHRGRVMSLYALVFGGVTPIGAMYAGAFIEGVGLRAYLAVSGAIGLAAVGLAYAAGMGKADSRER